MREGSKAVSSWTSDLSRLANGINMSYTPIGAALIGCSLLMWGAVFSAPYGWAFALSLPALLLGFYLYQRNRSRIRQQEAKLDKTTQLYQSAVEVLASAVDAKDQLARGHLQRVQAISLALAEAYGLKDSFHLDALRDAALLHDIGKLAIPDQILNKPGPLNDSERKLVQRHAAVGAAILSLVPFPHPVVPIVLHHHEKWDGRGYPDGLERDEIPLAARILAIADCYDTLRSDRPYRAGLEREAALAYIEHSAGTSFDPRLVECFIKRFEEIEQSVERRLNRRDQEGVQPARGEEEQDRIARTVFRGITSAHEESRALMNLQEKKDGRLEDTVQTVSHWAAKIARVIPHNAFVVYLIDKQEKKLFPRYSEGDYSEELNRLAIDFGRGISGRVAVEGRAILNVEPTEDFECCRDLAVNPDRFKLRSRLRGALAAPLIVDDELLGVITLYSESRKAFLFRHVRLMEVWARRAATDIHSAILLEQSKTSARTDSLTGLPNRRALNQNLHRILGEAQKRHWPVTVLVMDLDGFKAINDEMGHAAGDQVLSEIGALLRGRFRESDALVRFGGDEFVAILPGVDLETRLSFMEMVRASIVKHRFTTPGIENLSVGISLGAATYPDDSLDPDKLFILADQAMYRDKSEGKKRSRKAPNDESQEEPPDSEVLAANIVDEMELLTKVTEM